MPNLTGQCRRPLSKRKKDFSKVEFFTYDEGLCVQCMHIGSYDTEQETLRQLDALTGRDLARIFGHRSGLWRPVQSA